MKKLFLIFAVSSLLFWAQECAPRAAHAAPSPNYFVKRQANGDVTVMPYAAMCTAHAYNIGEISNDVFDNDYARRDEMNKVVAMKSELITREMKRQYDYLDATVKRFQIQLQKAVLVAQAEAAGAPAAGSATGGSGTGLAGADNCNGKSRTDTVYCLRNNYTKMQNAIAAGKIDRALKNQIQADIQAITNIGCGKDGCPNQINLTGVSADGKTKLSDFACKDTNLISKDKVQNCLYVISGTTNALEEAGRASAAKPTTVP
ncbi:MAG: hypothetical protein FWC61_01230 [Proteobacteria bacterium]|nr:hypothetical protein [Pseudomonadota bacterium]